ncbi:MAG: hypothetical protein HY758_07820 [Nitrospirae bacterium]|nr:hypothetical protein [Nitrospirota bacterium]
MEPVSSSATLRDYLRIIFRHKYLFLIVILAVLIPVYLGIQLQTPLYESQVTMIVPAVKEAKAGYYRPTFLGEGITDHLSLVKSNAVLERVVKALKLYERPIDYETNFSTRLKTFLIKLNMERILNRFEKMPHEQKEHFFVDLAVSRLNSNISTDPIKESSMFTITVRDFDPAASAVIANAVSRSYVMFDLEQQIAELKLKFGEKHVTVRQLSNYLEDFSKTLDGRPLPVIEALGPATVKIIEQAQYGLPSEGVSKVGLLIIGFMASIFLSLVLTFTFDFLDPTFKSPQEVEAVLNIPVLGTIPKKKSKIKPLINDSSNLPPDYVKSYQNLSEQMYLMVKDKSIKSFLVTDIEGSRETPAIIANIGLYLSGKQGHKVLIIDANFRTPLLSQLLHVADNSGLSDVIEGKVTFEDAVHDLGSNLYVLSSGNTEYNPVILLESSHIADIVNKSREKFEIIIITCADLRGFKDSAVLSSVVDGIIILIDEGKTHRMVAINAIAPMTNKKANIIGAILNNRTYVIPGIIYKLT